MRSAGLALMLGLAGCGQQPDVAPTQAAAAPVATGSHQAFMPQKPFQALGTEPFWSVEVTAGQMRYSDPENIAGTAFAATEQPEGAAMRYSGTLGGKPVSLLIQPGTCSDGMSDTVYSWQATLTIGDRTERGCARPR